ncbi:transporter [Craterilacuibacter sinensis]|uniref:Transporter n=1 Tax=Craterilacuibacter sinensis TaxID=2686017 RepID=A0A845BX83_9NEIS|nr:transporter [Craterilacuibacter sinensis]MXR37113.1 hypothetical protein [Craterilacuibacter sinensis]
MAARVKSGFALKPLLLCSLLLPAAAWSSPADVTRLQQELERLRQQNSLLERRLSQLESRIAPPVKASVAPASSVGQAVSPPAAVLPVGVPRQVAAPTMAAADMAPQQPRAPLPVVSEVPKSVDDIYQDATGFIQSGKFSFETGLTYTHYDTRELKVNGFYALDAIFLGKLNLDRIKSDNLTLDLAARWSPWPRWQFDVNLPLVARYSNFFSGTTAANCSSDCVGEASKTSSPKLGDTSFGVAYKLQQESATRPDVVLNLRARAPTGKHPYDVVSEKIEGQNNLTIPSYLPTGNGVWGTTLGVSAVKTVDPAVLYGSLSYTHNFVGTFNGSDIKLGDSISLGAGLAFALNDKLSIGMSYAQQFGTKTRVNDEKVPGSDSNSATLNLGLTYAMSKNLSVIPNLAVGLTPDAADYAFSLRFPYNF